MLFLKGHLASNSYDGYDPHHHVMLLDMTLSEYERDVHRNGNVFPGRALAGKIVDPHSLAWVRENLVVGGYDWLERVEPQHSSFYTFEGQHDGIDTYLFAGGPGVRQEEYFSTYINGNGYHASCEIYRLDDDISDQGNRTPFAMPEHAQPEPSPQYEVSGVGTTAQSPFWDRRYRILIGDGGETALDVSELRCTFNIEKTVMTQPNLSVVTVYNLAPNTEAQFVQDGMRIVIEAGYRAQDQYGLIFDGKVIHPSRGKEDATTYYLSLQGLDGADFLAQSMVSQSLARQQPVRSVIDACVTASVPVETGTISSLLPDNAFIRGRVLFGMSRKYMQMMAQSVGAALYVEDGKLNMIAAPDLPAGEIFQLDETSGLVGFPKQTESGISFSCLLNPRLRLNDLVFLNNESIKQQTGSIGQVIRPLAASGIYRVTKINHVGDTRGSDWHTNCEAVAQDQWIPF